ncbi:MAG TPA: DUF488 family protein [Acidimicrobiia bacterium]|jgi:uncharacterized protein YeaO (DUF488 family)|nr:DUF488 family protein [Acidimicrobiia bacterium]
MSFRVHRVYDRDVEGYRVLVDRLWPRGLTKEEANLDEWLKDVAPSTELRRWYGHEASRFDEFAHRYRAELEESPAAEAVAHLLELSSRKPVILLLTATKDLDISGARVLADHLDTLILPA